MTHVLPVRLPSGAYDVLIGSGLLEEAGERLRDLAAGRRLAVVTDAVVAPIFADRLLAALEPVGAETSLIVLPAGEETKSFDGLAGLCDQLLQKGLDRGDLVLALGGGVIGDIAGFAAAIYKRGVDFVQLPTSLLAQVDSSVGGKTAIDTPRGKNVIGAFHQPRRVLADLDALKSLPPREVRCGFAEIIKYGLLGDAGFFAWLETNGAAVRALRPGPLAHAVVRSVEMKAQIVAEDEKEAGRRALLNLGHTFGHALETETGFGGALLHGEAVGAGMAMAFRFSAALRLCNPLDARRVERALREAGLPTTLAEIFREPPSADRLIAHMAQDKKAKAGALVFVLARAIGDAFLARGVDAEALRRFLLEDGAV